MKAIFLKEFRSFFSNVSGYVVIGLFLTITGLFLWVIPGQFNVLDAGYANLDGLFVLAPWLFLFLCPAITMRFFSDEKQSGTWDLLTTKPISAYDIVLGKYLAGLSLVFLALIPVMIYYFTVGYLAQPQFNVDSGQFWGSFIGLLFLGLIYIAIGIFSSSLTPNQIANFLLTATLCFFFYYGFDLIAMFLGSGITSSIIETMGIHSHYQSISRGVVDSRDIAHYLLISIVFIGLTVKRVNEYK